VSVLAASREGLQRSFVLSVLSTSTKNNSRRRSLGGVLLFDRPMEPGDEFQEVLANANAALPPSPLPRQCPEQAGRPAVLPGGGRRGRRAGGGGGAAAAVGADGAVQSVDSGGEGPGRRPLQQRLPRQRLNLLAVREETLGEEAAFVAAAASSRAVRARGEGVLEHAGLVAVLRHGAPEAAVTGPSKSRRWEDFGGNRGGVGGSRH